MHAIKRLGKEGEVKEQWRPGDAAPNGAYDVAFELYDVGYVDRAPLQCRKERLFGRGEDGQMEVGGLGADETGQIERGRSGGEVRDERRRMGRRGEDATGGNTAFMTRRLCVLSMTTGFSISFVHLKEERTDDRGRPDGEMTHHGG